ETAPLELLDAPMGYPRMPCCQTPPRTRSTTERDDLDRTDAIQPYLIFIYAWSGCRPMNNSAKESGMSRDSPARVAGPETDGIAGLGKTLRSVQIQLRSVLGNPASVLKSNLELSRNLVGG